MDKFVHFKEEITNKFNEILDLTNKGTDTPAFGNKFEDTDSIKVEFNKTKTEGLFIAKIRLMKNDRINERFNVWFCDARTLFMTIGFSLKMMTKLTSHRRNKEWETLNNFGTWCMKRSKDFDMDLTVSKEAYTEVKKAMNMLRNANNFFKNRIADCSIDNRQLNGYNFIEFDEVRMYKGIETNEEEKAKVILAIHQFALLGHTVIIHRGKKFDAYGLMDDEILIDKDVDWHKRFEYLMSMAVMESDVFEKVWDGLGIDIKPLDDNQKRYIAFRDDLILSLPSEKKWEGDLVRKKLKMATTITQRIKSIGKLYFGMDDEKLLNLYNEHVHQKYTAPIKGLTAKDVKLFMSSYYTKDAEFTMSMFNDDSGTKILPKEASQLSFDDVDKYIDLSKLKETKKTTKKKPTKRGKYVIKLDIMSKEEKDELMKVVDKHSDIGNDVE